MAQLHPGTVLPPILGAESSSRGTILILAIQSGCDICEDSMPFYKRLLELKAAGRIPVRIIAVMPNPPGVAEKFVSSHGLSLPVVPDANLALAHVPGTPTMILVDAKRTVQRVWGEQSRVEQATDIAELESLAGPSASPQRGRLQGGVPNSSRWTSGVVWQLLVNSRRRVLSMGGLTRHTAKDTLVKSGFEGSSSSVCACPSVKLSSAGFVLPNCNLHKPEKTIRLGSRIPLQGL